MQTSISGSLVIILQNMRQVIASLQLMMQKEQQELSSARPDSYRLQSLTEDKQAALNTLSYLDDRLSETGNKSGLTAPFAQSEELNSLWLDLCRELSVLQQTNQHTGLLLQQQMQWTQQALAVLAPLKNQHFYGPDGQAK
ncbi:flagellar export chaperone FlgN [Tatumella citrea]|uniref:Flagellar biosynthesis protein FlgN n=1 Tax=Tatumella citrea TaxID=53336 RepID=A0A1Y0L6I1_TATCI|nr:flagellar export chaperone FlgN [Tatumella citrea]ARU93623.1 hypothetical protein A7K98_07445 [Tatumella citrea]ARU97661.1 hypothetical protein A7K99_07445 [Tatumella citrea]